MSLGAMARPTDWTSRPYTVEIESCKKQRMVLLALVTG